MPDSTVATSAAPIADGKEESGNLTSGQVAASLFAKATKEPAAKTPNATEENAPEEAAAEEAPPAEETPTETVADSEAESAEKPTEEAEPAEESTAEPDAEESEDEVLSNRPLDDKTKERIHKRIGKEVAKTKAERTAREAAERENAELKARLQEKESATQQVPVQQIVQSDLPPHIAAIDDLNAIEATRRQAKDAVRWVDSMLDAESEDGAIPEEATKLGLTTRKALKDAQRNAKLALEDHLPQREDFIKRRAHFQQQAHQEFPFLKDRNTPEYQMAQNARRSNPWLNSLPNADMIIGFQIEGYKAIEARKAAAAEKAKAKTAPAKPKITPKPSSDQTAVSSTGTTARAPVGAVQRQAMTAERERLEAKGGVTAGELTAFLTRSAQQSRNSR